MHTDALDQHWGMFHEIGHNVQRKDWTFEGYTECTVNIFSMFQMEFLAKVGQLYHYISHSTNNWLLSRSNVFPASFIFAIAFLLPYLVVTAGRAILINLFIRSIEIIFFDLRHTM